MEIFIVFLIILSIVLTYFLINSQKNSKSNSVSDLLELSETLTKQINEVRKEIDSNSKESRLEIQEKLNDINKQMNDFSKSTTENMSSQFKQSSQVIREVTQELEKIKGTNEKVLSFAHQMKTLEKILGNQKQRGIFSEIQLENLLANVLPPDLYKMQFTFKNKETVDAIIIVNEFIIPIDAKFSLDNYNRMIESSDEEELKNLENNFKSDIRKRIDETSKYIRPNEGTVDYAYMFIPADGLYQDLLNSRVGTLKINQKDLVTYAMIKKVMIVSPMTLYPMLQVTVRALNNMKIEDSIKDVLKNVEKLSNHLNAYKIYHEKLGTNLGIVVNHYNTTNKEFKKIDKDVTKLSSGNLNINLTSEDIEKPTIEN